MNMMKSHVFEPFIHQVSSFWLAQLFTQVVCLANEDGWNKNMAGLWLSEASFAHRCQFLTLTGMYWHEME